MWGTRVVEARYRGLITLTHFANPNGTPGEKTRSWFSLEGQPIVAWAGFCKNTAEFGPVYAGMTMEANGAAMPYNERMPVLLEPPEYARWLNGSIKDVISIQFSPPPPRPSYPPHLTPVSCGSTTCPRTPSPHAPPSRGSFTTGKSAVMGRGA